MIYSDFVAMVEEQLSVDADRRGLENFRAQQIRNSVVDLQRFIRGYRKGHTTTYQAADLTAVGCSMRGSLPDQAIPEAFWINSTAAVTSPPCDVAAPVRNRLDFWNWTQRDHLANSPCERRLYAYTLSPYSKTFIIHPALNDETELLLVWEGLKRDFANGDTVPWPEDASEASAAYVKWRIGLEVDKNPPLAREFQAIYVTKRLALFRDFQERLDAEKPDEEYDATDTPIPGTDSGSGVDPSITSESDLASVATINLTVPILKVWVDSATGLSQVWRLLSGSDAGVAGAIVRPNDYNALYPKTWYKAG